ncbi:MAG: DUF5053 domain-containing protein [Muribaculaceae bacterium]
MNNSPLDIRSIAGADALTHINCAYIAKRFFNRTRAWFIQRLNNNKVNGKPVSFTEAELLTLRSALLTLSKELKYYSSNIPNTETMDIKVYVITDQTAIDLITDDDIDGFKAYLAEDDTLYFPEPETFATEEEALAFCAGIGYGIDERASIERYPLRSCEPTDIPFIEAIENY